MSPAVAILIKLGVRLVVFTGVFWFAAKKNEKVIFEKKWAPPLVALVFAILNTGLYWMLKPILNLATMGAVPMARGSGAAPLLLDRVVDESRERGELSVELEVFAQNARALTLYALIRR